jgi:hypothetical protein
MLGGRKITDTLTGETVEGSVTKCCLQRGILLHVLCCLVYMMSARDSGMAVIHSGMHHTHCSKIPKHCLTASSGDF